MGKPTESELEHALETAKSLREHGKDGDFLGKSLLNHHYRIGYLLQVLHAAEHYLHSGQAEHEHSVLVRAIDKARSVEDHPARPGHELDSDFGLE